MNGPNFYLSSSFASLAASSSLSLTLRFSNAAEASSTAAAVLAASGFASALSAGLLGDGAAVRVAE